MANTKKRWTAEEIDILKKYYPTEGDAWENCKKLQDSGIKVENIQKHFFCYYTG